MRKTVDKMTLTVLDDGSAKVEVDGISGANHTTADGLLKMFTRLMGGSYKDRRRAEAKEHAHRLTTIRHGR